MQPSSQAPAGSELELNQPDAIRSNLEKFVGQRVTVSLVGGEELQGIVSKVGTTTLHLMELTGKEFFDAFVRIEHISAVTVKMRNK